MQVVENKGDILSEKLGFSEDSRYTECMKTTKELIKSCTENKRRLANLESPNLNSFKYENYFLIRAKKNVKFKGLAELQKDQFYIANPKKMFLNKNSKKTHITVFVPNFGLCAAPSDAVEFLSYE